MLDWPSSSGFLCFINYDLVGLWVDTWRRNEPPWCPVLFVCEMGRTATQSVWCWSKPVVTIHCCKPWFKRKHFFISSTFSVFNIKFIQSVFWISKIECIFAVKCCELVFFLYIRHEFDTAINAIFIKNFSKDFPYLFVRRRATTTELFFWLLFYYYFFSMLWHF